MEISVRTDFFSQLILSCHELFLWRFDPQGKLLDTRCPDPVPYQTLIRLDFPEGWTGLEKAYTHPLIFSNEIGLFWILSMPRAEVPYYHLLGPVLSGDLSRPMIQSYLSRFDLSVPQRRQLSELLHRCPVLSISRIYEYAIMLHFCLFEETITAGDLHFREQQTVSDSQTSGASTDYHGTYELERQMVAMVREGDLQYKEKTDRLAVTGQIGQLAPATDLMRQSKNAILVCIVLFSRAAIEGGLPAETALTLADRYFQAIEAADQLSELQAISVALQDDFVQRVHHLRMAHLSPVVRACCDYIDLHLSDPLTVSHLAGQAGYSEYHFCRLFKAETGCTLKAYILQKKLARAEVLLQDPAVPIQEVSASLGFSSVSHFGQCFKKEYGISPSQWRKDRSR